MTTSNHIVPGAGALARLETPLLQIDIDRDNGALCSITSEDWAVLDRPELGQAFRLLVPVPGRRANWVLGSDQDSPEVTVSDDGAITCRWSSVVDQHGDRHQIGIHTTVAAAEDRIVFAVEIDNQAENVVENVYFPDLGDVTAPPTTGRLATFCHTYANALRTELRPRFSNHAGYFGVLRPTYTDGPMTTAPQVPWTLYEDGERGLYLGVDQPSPEVVTWFAELEPGYSDSLESTVPVGPRIGKHDVAVHVAAVHVPFVQPGERRTLTPISLAGYRGDWHKGADLYRRRRAEWGMSSAQPPDWAQGPQAWLQYQMNSPEGERRLRFEELPALASECAAAGVGVIQLVGWNDGGQDQNNPSHDADPDLGGADGLRRAIAACHDLGVRIVLFTKFTWADRATERFRRELVEQAIKDPYGDYYMHPGYRYQTVTQLLDINTKRLVPMCFASEDYLKVCDVEFAKVVGYGAAGMLFDEALHHGPALVCFDVGHGHRQAQPVYADDNHLIERFRRQEGLPGDFLFAAEAPYDWMFDEYELGYFRTEDRQHVPLSRYLRPEAQLMTAVTGFEDRNMINQCLLYRYVISYEPFNFKGRMTDVPLTAAYGGVVDAFRADYREWLWDAAFVDTVGVEVWRSDGTSHHPAAGFRHPDGRLAAVVVNYDETESDVRVALDGTAATGHQYRIVGAGGWHPAGEEIVLPPRSAAVLLPADAVHADSTPGEAR